MATVSGTVYDSTGTPAVGRIVRAYRRDTGALLAGTKTLSSSGDADYTSVRMLLLGNGTDGATTFVDDGPGALTMTKTGAGTAAIATAQSKHGGSSIRLTGEANVFTPGPSSVIGTGPVTLEGWIYVTTIPSGGGSGIQCGSEALLRANIYVNNAGQLILDQFNTGPIITSSGAISAGAWTHVAMVRNGTTATLFIGGSASGTNTFSSTIGNSGGFGIFSFGSATDVYWDSVRVTSTARYTSNFTPGGEPPVLPLGTNGTYSIDVGAFAGEVQVVALDDAAGSLENDLIHRTFGV